MSLAFWCTWCGKAYSVAGQLAGRKVRCLACGLVQRIPMPADPPSGSDRRPDQDTYPLAEVLPSAVPIPVSEPIGSGDRERSSGVLGSMREGGVASVRKHRAGRWRRLVRDYAGESSVLEQEILLLVALERGRLAGDLCPVAARPFVLRVEPLRAMGLPSLEYRRDDAVQVRGDRRRDRDRRGGRAPASRTGTRSDGRELPGHGGRRGLRSSSPHRVRSPGKCVNGRVGRRPLGQTVSTARSKIARRAPRIRLTLSR